MTNEAATLIEERLRCVLDEMRLQTHLAVQIADDELGFAESLAQISELLEHDEYGIAFESTISLLEEIPIVLSGRVAVRLLEAGLLLGYKSELDSDKVFDRRTR